MVCKDFFEKKKLYLKIFDQFNRMLKSCKKFEFANFNKTLYKSHDASLIKVTQGHSDPTQIH